MRRLRELGVEVVPERHVLIAGDLTDGEGGPLVTWYPATGEVLAEVPAATPAQLDVALDAARRAFDEGPWPRLPAEQRAGVLAAMADHLASRLEEIQRLVTLDNGKTVREAAVDGHAAVGALRSAAGAATRLYGDQPAPSESLLRLTWREPVGVVAGITPFNAPLMFAALKAAPALAAGNTVVLKPSPRAPLAPILLGEAALAAGLPEGALNILPGGTDLGAALCADPRIDTVTLTGGTAAGAAVMTAAAPTIKKLLLELGGKSANIVFADADLDRAVPAALGAVFRNAGQRCFSGTRLVVQAPVYDEVVERVAKAADALRLGDPFEPATQVGALVDAEALAAVERFVAAAMDDGASVRAGGRAEAELPGWFYRPTVLEAPDNRAFAAQEECFGPVLTVLPFSDADDAVRIANDSRYGLAGGVWSRDVGTALGVARRVRSGVLWVNTYAVVSGDVPFGGYKQSGLGREAGASGALAYTEEKSVIIDLSGGDSAPTL